MIMNNLPPDVDIEKLGVELVYTHGEGDSDSNDDVVIYLDNHI